MPKKKFSFFGYELSKKEESHIPKEVKENFYTNFEKLKSNPGNFEIFEFFHYDMGNHPHGHVDFECEFAVSQIDKIKPRSILDIGSYRHFILGLLACYKLTTIDIRERIPAIKNEKVITCDAKKIDAPDNSFDMILSLCAVEHFGLGRYGDDFDPDADNKAFNEIIRVLKPNGYLIFSTTITNAPPSIGFNGCRIYNYKMINDFCSRLSCIDEAFWSHKEQRGCSLSEVTTARKEYDIYCGCWIKKS